MTMRPSKEGINTNMFSKFMLHKIIGNLYSSCIVTKKRCGDITRNPKISQQPSKPYNFCSSSGKCSKFGLCTGMRYNSLFLGLLGNRRRANSLFLDFQAIGEEPRRIQYPVMKQRSVGHLPKWSLSKHEAKVDYHEHRINSEMMSPISIIAHEVSDQ